MNPTRSPLLDLTPLGCDPVRLHDLDDTGEALRRDLAASRNAIAIGVDYAAIEAALLVLFARDPRHEACG